MFKQTIGIIKHNFDLYIYIQMCIVQSAVHYKCLIMQNVHVTGIFKRKWNN